MTKEKLHKIYCASYLLPNPGGQVVRELIAEILELRGDVVESLRLRKENEVEQSEEV